MQRYNINQPLSSKLPVTVLSGFLGAGKTKQSSLVFIGRNLPKQDMLEALESCQVAA
jgi:hypothetical protein